MTKDRIAALLVGLAVCFATAILMLATEPRMAIGWDEGYTLGREARLRLWFQALRDPVAFAANWQPPAPAEELVQADGTSPPRRDQIDTQAKLLFDRHVLAWFWPFARQEPHGHPPFYALLGLTGDFLAPSWRDLPRARLGPILLFSLAAGVLYQFVASRCGRWAAALAVGSWVAQPNMFGHGHYAAYDGVLTSLWVLAIVVFARAVAPRTGAKHEATRLGWTMAFGLIAGCSFATKLTGWFLPLPFLVWAGLYRSRQGFKTLFLGLLAGFAVLFALMPPWWTEPVSGVIRFFSSNLNRAKTQPIPVQFLNVIYNTPEQSLPWYNTLVWTVLVTPVGFLLFAGVGFWVALRNWQRQPIGLLIAGNWTFLVILRAMPHTPGHDGVRLFLPAFGILALLGGLGVRFLQDRWGKWAKLAILAALIEGIASVAVMMPVPLSYFSPVVGGLPGATALGMEPTYYWDALDPELRRWLAVRTPPGRTFAFRTNPRSWLYLQRTGELPRQLAGVDPGPPVWMVIQNRPGVFEEVDRALVAHGEAKYVVTKLGVPLVWVYPYSQFERLAAQQGP
jgi:4-amino-4-deoxy-L-arabinose transferase-like glycosyltransferase